MCGKKRNLKKLAAGAVFLLAISWVTGLQAADGTQAGGAALGDAAPETGLAGSALGDAAPETGLAGPAFGDAATETGLAGAALEAGGAGTDTEDAIIGSVIEGRLTSGEEEEIDVGGILDFSELDRFLEEEEQSSFSDYIKKCISGEWEWSLRDFGKALKTLFFGSFEKSRGTLVQILVLAVAFSILHNFTNTFQNSQVGTISYYIVYLVLMALLMRSFLAANDLVVDALHTVMGFMDCLLPTFTLALVFSNGQASALGFYEMALLIIYLVEYAVVYVLVPAVRIYAVLVLLNHITAEEMLSNFTELVAGGISWALKMMFTLVIGLNAVQGLIGPTLDQYRRSVMARGLSAIPGIGNTVQSVSGLVLSMGALIRNSVGAAALVALVALCASPCVQMAVIALLYKLAAAVMEPVVDRRISGAVAGIGSGIWLLLKSLFTVVVLFFITIAVVCVAAGVSAGVAG